MAETENNRWAKGASRAKYTVRHYGRNYSVITEQFECGRLRYYATIESLYGANRFTETERELFYDAYCTYCYMTSITLSYLLLHDQQHIVILIVT